MRSRFVALLLIVGALLALAAARALASVSHGNQISKRQSAPPSTAGPHGTGAAAPLLSVLGVLRRPQTRADLPPALREALKERSQWPPLRESGTPVIRLIRLAAVTPWGAKVFLIPLRRTGHADRLEVLELSSRMGAGGCCDTASDIEHYGTGSFGGKAHHRHGVLIVPDGVSKVTIFPPNQRGKPSRGISATVHNNTAVFEFHGPLADPFKYMTWYGPSGPVIKHRG